MKGNGILTHDDLHKHTSNNEELYFQKVNTDLLRRIREKKEREKAAASEQAESDQSRDKKAA